jgi:hypothetical protein
MSQENPYRIFVTHDWADDEDYLRVFEYLEENKRFYYRNVANPSASRPPNADAEREALRAQISHCEVVIALAGQYTAHAAALDFQLMFAQAVKKPVIVLRKFGSKDPLPKHLTQGSADTLDWDARALVSAIKRQARGEASGQWDVVEFKLD